MDSNCNLFKAKYGWYYWMLMATVDAILGTISAILAPRIAITLIFPAKMSSELQGMLLCFVVLLMSYTVFLILPRLRVREQFRQVNWFNFSIDFMSGIAQFGSVFMYALTGIVALSNVLLVVKVFLLFVALGLFELNLWLMKLLKEWSK